MSDEITVPLGVREFLPHWVEETVLGHARGATAQYRYGRLHIRRYDDCFKVHVDRADPRTDALGHLVHDAPEILAAAVCGPLAAFASYCAIRRIKRGAYRQ